MTFSMHPHIESGIATKIPPHPPLKRGGNTHDELSKLASPFYEGQPKLASPFYDGLPKLASPFYEGGLRGISICN